MADPDLLSDQPLQLVLLSAEGIDDVDVCFRHFQPLPGANPARRILSERSGCNKGQWGLNREAIGADAGPEI